MWSEFTNFIVKRPIFPLMKTIRRLRRDLRIPLCSGEPLKSQLPSANRQRWRRQTQQCIVLKKIDRNYVQKLFTTFSFVEIPLKASWVYARRNNRTEDWSGKQKVDFQDSYHPFISVTTCWFLKFSWKFGRMWKGENGENSLVNWVSISMSYTRAFTFLL